MTAVVTARPLSVGLSLNARTLPIVNGQVRPATVEIVASGLPIGELFWRQLKFADFDVSELSMSSLSIATSKGPTPWVALPVFTTRAFFHTGILVRAAAGIASPADLRGKRFGVQEYQQTAMVWIRGYLQHEHGIRAQEITWWMQRSPELSHGGSTGFKPPDGVRLTYVAPGTGIGEMLLAGELDVLPFYPPSAGDLVDRSRIDLYGDPRVRQLFPDRAAEARRYHAATQIFPINHCVVMRRALAEANPELVRDVYDCFVRAKALATQRRNSLLGPALETGVVDGELATALRTDPLAYGVRENRPTIDGLLDYIYEQGLSPRRVAIEELFAKPLLDV